MKEDQDDQTYPVINVEEFIGKTVGRRKLSSPLILQDTGREVFKGSDFRMCDPGVYLFNSHEEADEWMMEMAMKRARLADKN